MRIRTIGKIAGGCVAVGAFVLVLSSRVSISAQAESWTPPHRMLLTPERALAMLLARDRKLDYVPGEVLVKFREGVSAAGQQRAMMALRSNPSPSSLRWVGDVAVLSDPRELDATILAAQLNSQPEVASAEPNYLYRTSATPNDPDFASQWHLAKIQVTNAWSLTEGLASVPIAIIDSGADSNQPDLKPKLLPGWSFLTGTSNTSDTGCNTGGVPDPFMLSLPGGSSTKIQVQVVGSCSGGASGSWQYTVDCPQ
jgi:hypothetical protein